MSLIQDLAMVAEVEDGGISRKAETSFLMKFPLLSSNPFKGLMPLKGFGCGEIEYWNDGILEFHKAIQH